MARETNITKINGVDNSYRIDLAGHVTSEDWVIISAIYIGGQTIIDGIARLRGYNA